MGLVQDVRGWLIRPTRGVDRVVERLVSFVPLAWLFICVSHSSFMRERPLCVSDSFTTTILALTIRDASFL